MEIYHKVKFEKKFNKIINAEAIGWIQQNMVDENLIYKITRNLINSEVEEYLYIQFLVAKFVT